jgi:hypothetical protein
MLTRGAVQACLVLHCAHAFVLAPVGNLQDPVGKRLSIAQGKVTAHEPLPCAILRQGGRVEHIHGRNVQLKMLMDPSLAQNPQLALLFPSFLLPFYLLSCPLTWYLLLQFGFVFGLKAMASTADYVDRKVRTGRPCTLCGRRLSGPCLLAAEFMYPVACPVHRDLVAALSRTLFPAYTLTRPLSHTPMARTRTSINVAMNAATHRSILPSLDQEIVCATRTKKLLGVSISPLKTGANGGGQEEEGGWMKGHGCRVGH